mmetsp:Transcript_99/g.169  ORF Transcript_99/g.169 Transcript_99/m.169 type:complete len:165 (-) Transcript_99:171-665(-)
MKRCSVFLVGVLLTALLATTVGGPLRKARKHERRVPISASHQKVQDLAAFSVEEFKSHSFRTREYQQGLHFEVLAAERTLAIHDDPKHSSRNYFLTIRVFLEQECTVHKAHVVFYPNTGTKMVVSREVDTHAKDCEGAFYVSEPPHKQSHFVSPYMKEVAENHA